MYYFSMNSLGTFPVYLAGIFFLLDVQTCFLLKKVIVLRPSMDRVNILYVFDLRNALLYGRNESHLRHIFNYLVIFY